MNERETLLDWRVTRSGGGPGDRALRLRGTAAGSGERIYTAPVTGAALDGDCIVFDVTAGASYACPLSEASFEHRLAELPAEVASFTEEQARAAIARVAELRGERDRETARRLRGLLPDGASAGVVVEFDPDREYYFACALIARAGDDAVISEREAEVHVGMFQDSVIVSMDGGDGMPDLRFWPYRGSRAEFYSLDERFGPVVLANAEGARGPIEVDALGRRHLLPPGAHCACTDPGDVAHLIEEPTAPPIDK